jgi:hypothetical protein
VGGLRGVRGPDDGGRARGRRGVCLSGVAWVAGRAGVVSLCAVAVGLGFGGGVARGALEHEFLAGPSGVIGGGVLAGAGVEVPGGLSGVRSMTVAPGEAAGEDRHLWVAEAIEGAGRSRVDEWDAVSGQFQAQLEKPTLEVGLEAANGVAVGRVGAGAGERQVYVGAAGGVVGVFDASGKLEGTWSGADTLQLAFGEVAGLAVDESGAAGDWASGDVYVNARFEDVIDLIKPEAGGVEGPAVAELAGTCERPGPGEVVGGHVSPQCPGSSFVPFGRTRGVEVDQANGDVLVMSGPQGEEANVVDVFAPVSGKLGEYKFLFAITGTPEGAFENIKGVAVDASTGDIYIAEKRSVGGEHVGVLSEFRFASGGEAAGFKGRLGGTPTGPGGALVPFAEEARSVAVDQASGDVYFGDFAPSTETGAVDVFGGDIVVPGVEVSAVSGLSAGSAVLNGTLTPEGGATTCEFEYGTSASYGQAAACVGPGSPGEPVPQGTTGVAVRASLTGLASGTTYFYRLSASNGNGHENLGECPVDCGQFTTSGPNVGAAASVADVASTSATLHASVNPNGAATSVFFDYGTSTAYGFQAPAAPGTPIGESSGEPVEVKPVHIQGLSPATVYHYRVVAVSDVEVSPGHVEAHEFPGGDESFQTQGAPAGGLPDGRQWQLVSPASKAGARIEPINQLLEVLIQASADGSAITYAANAPTEAEPAGYANQLQLLSTRGPEDWSSKDIAIPHAGATGKSEGVGEDYRFFSEDLATAVVQPAGAFTPLKPYTTEPSEQTAYQRENTTGLFTPLVTPVDDTASPIQPFGEEGTCPALEATCGPRFEGATPDDRHIALHSPVQLTAATAPDGGLYEWAAGHLELVSILPENEGGKAATQVAALGLGSDSIGGSEVARNALSSDGSRVFFTTSGSEEHLYMRDLATGETLRLDVGAANSKANFQEASPDGSRVFFTDGAKLTGDSGARGQTTLDLYECEIVMVVGKLHCDLSDLTPISAGGESAGVQGTIIGIGEHACDAGMECDVYFVANGVLENSGVPVAGAVHGNCDGQLSVPGDRCNLYVRHDGVTRRVAVLSGEDTADFETSLPFLSARVSPDGEWLAFVSHVGLTGYDNRDAKSGMPDQEVYLYNAVTGRLVCGSCDPSGAQPTGGSSVPGWTPFAKLRSRYQSRYLDDSGRLFFDSEDALVAGDVDGVQDVYEWEPPGVGDCTEGSGSLSAGSGGCLGLISSGESGEPSEFVDASESGGDVFFLTAQSLVPEDFDKAYDVYDAHECGDGVACFPARVTVPPACEATESCKVVPTPQPEIFGAPASSTFIGPGNPAVPAKSVAPTKAQQLAAALKACRKKAKKKHAACEAQARKKYGAKAKKSQTAKHVSRGSDSRRHGSLVSHAPGKGR